MDCVGLDATATIGAALLLVLLVAEITSFDLSQHLLGFGAVSVLRTRLGPVGVVERTLTTQPFFGFDALKRT